MNAEPRWLLGLLSSFLESDDCQEVAGDLIELAQSRPPWQRSAWLFVSVVGLRWRMWRHSRSMGAQVPTASGGEARRADRDLGGSLGRGLIHDLKVAFRGMRRAPSVSVAITLTLALAIGATTAIFSVVDAVLLKPLPLEKPDELVLVYGWDQGASARDLVSPLDLQDFQTATTNLSGLGGWTPERYAFTGSGEAEQLLIERYSPGLFEVLGTSAALGRIPSADREQDRGTLVLTHGFWTRRFGADPSVIGRTIQLDDQPYEVVGVLAAEFRFPDNDQVAGWMPLFRFSYEEQRWTRHTQVIGRLAPGGSIESAHAELSAVAARLAEDFPRTNEGWGVELVPASDLIGEHASLRLVFGAVALVLLIAAMNVANLFLVRSTERRSEWELRRALGAGRFQLARQMLIESGMHAALGATAGLIVAALALRALLSLNPGGLPQWNPVTLDGRVLLFTLAVTGSVALAAGVVPALGAGRASDPTDRGTRRGTRSAHSEGRERSMLSALQVAIAVALSVGAGLLGTSLLNLRAQDPGFRTSGLLTLTIELPTTRYSYEDGTLATGFERIREAVSSVPGVDQSGWVTALPMDPGGTDYDIDFMRVERPDLTPQDTPPTADLRVASAGYLETLEIPLIAGRAFSDDDREDTAPVVLINQTLLDEFFPGEDPVGQGLHLYSPDGPPWQIVGVVGSVKHRGLDDLGRPEIYAPLRQMTHDGMTLVARTRGESTELLPGIRAAIASVDPNVPLIDVATMDERVDATVAERRFGTLLLSSFAVLGLILALVGVQGTLAYSVTRRRREIGVRLAIGADRRDVIGSVLLRGARVTGAGLVLGLVAVFAAGSVVRPLLYGVSPADPVTLAIISALVAGVALVASLIPALRAARVDPAESLRPD